MSVQIRLAFEFLGLEAAADRARFGAGVMASAPTQYAFEDAGAFACDSMVAFAFAIMGIGKVTATALEARDKRGRLLARAGGMANVVAAATLAEDGGIACDVYTTMGAEHADTVAAKEGSEGAVAVQEHDGDRGIGEGLEAFGTQQPSGEQAEFRFSKAGVETNFGKECLLSVDGPVSIPGWNAADLDMDPFLARDDVPFPQHVGEVLLVGEGIPQRNLAGDGEGEVTSGNGGTILNGTAGPSAFNEAKGRVGNGTFDGSADAHDEAHGRVAVELEEGAGPMFATESGLSVWVREATVPSNDEAGGLNDRGTSLGSR